jgi:hypothetical protein
MKAVTDFHELVGELRAHALTRVTLVGKVATYTRPKGGQITFRGRLVVAAETSAGERLEYVEQVPAYVTAPGAAELPLTEEARGDLKNAQLALLRQLRAYRAQYLAAMQSARADLTERLAAAGIAVAASEGEGPQ